MKENSRGVIVASLDDRHFCSGIDFASLRNHWNAGKMVRVQNYYFNLTRFAHFMANYKEPMMMDASGSLRNAALSIFLNVPMVVNRELSSGCKWAINFRS